MAYRSLGNGVVEADTLEELLAYEEATHKTAVSKVVELPVDHVESVSVASPSSATHITPGVESPEELWKRYCGKIKEKKFSKQRKVLALIKGAGSRRMSVQDLAKSLKVDGFAAGGTVSGIRKTADSLKVPADQVIIRDEDGHYRAGELLERFDPPEP